MEEQNVIISNNTAVIQIVTFSDFPAIVPPVLSATTSASNAVLTWTYDLFEGVIFDIYKSSDGASYSKIDAVDSVLTYTDTNVCL